MTTITPADTITLFGVVVLYREYMELIGYWVFVVYGVISYFAYADRVGSVIKLLSWAIPLVVYYFQPLEVGESLHLSLVTLAAWTWIVINILQRPLQTAVSFEVGRRAGKKMFED